MKITPLDIRKQEFRKSFHGYDREEVDTFLEMVSEELERMNKENISLQERVRSLEASLQDYRNIERTLQDTLLAAQHTAEDIRQNARKEAELMVKEARLRAEQWIDDAHGHVKRIEEEIIELKMQRDSFISSLKILFSSQVEFLRSFGKDVELPSREGILLEAAQRTRMGGTEDREGLEEIAVSLVEERA